MVINMGPQHPSTHGVLRLVLQVDGETVPPDHSPHRIPPHRHRRTAENLTRQQAVVVTDRMDYLPPTDNLAYALAVEKLMGIGSRSGHRTSACSSRSSPARLASYRLGTHAMELGAMSVFFYCWRDRELILDIMDFLSGVRMMTSFINIGGVRADLPDGFHKKVQDFLDVFPARVDEYDLLTNNRIWEKRTLGICVITRRTPSTTDSPGRTSADRGIKWDLRKDRPYLTYPRVLVRCPRRENRRRLRPVSRPAGGDAPEPGDLRPGSQNISPRGGVRTADRKISPPPEGGARKTEHGGAHPPFPPLHGNSSPERSTARSNLPVASWGYTSSRTDQTNRIGCTSAPLFREPPDMCRHLRRGLVADVIAAIPTAPSTR